MPLYFAYGANLDRDSMARRCPKSRVLGQARLPRHRLAVMREGYLTVVRDPRDSVVGLLWELALADVAALDRFEGVSGGLYVKAHLAVLAEAGSRRALVYLGTNPGPGFPVPGYLEAVSDAARREGLPAGYRAGIAALGPRRRPPALASRGPTVRPNRATPFDADRGATGRIGEWSP